MQANLEDERNENVGSNGASGRALKSGETERHKLHGRNCSVCRHGRREDIERDILAWRSPKEIVKEYALGNRAAVYRHAHAFGLMERRYMNLRAALSRIIERAGEVPVTAWAVVAAVRACARINARGKWMAQREVRDAQSLLEGMSREELLAYAENGTLPDPSARPPVPKLRVVVEHIGRQVKPGESPEPFKVTSYDV